MDNKPSDLYIMVATAQEKIGSLNDKVSSLHSRQTKMEEGIESVMKDVLYEIKKLKDSADAEFKIINEYINKQKGRSDVIKVIIGTLLTVVGGLIGKFILK